MTSNEHFPRLRNSTGESIAVVQRKQNSLQIRIQFQGDDLFCHFDRTGRFLRATGRNIAYRRGLDNRLLRISMDRADHPPAPPTARRRHYADLADNQKNTFFAEVYQAAGTALRAESFETWWMERIGQWSPETLANDGPAFRETFKPVSILPPDQYKALVIQFAEGCSYNECLFCDFYRDRRFHVKNPRQLATHLDGLQAFFGERLLDRTGIFLGDGNALVVAANRLIPAIQQIRDTLGPVADSFATFMDTFNLNRKSIEALQAVHEAGVTDVYVGLESGYDPLRKFLLKPGPGEEALDAIRTLKQAGFRVSPIVMVGVGDRRMANAHFDATVRLLQDANLTREDTVFLSPFVDPSHSLYDTAVATGDIIPYTADEIDAEMARWKQALSSSLTAKVTGYYVREHVY